jgi:hypothetical protein
LSDSSNDSDDETIASSIVSFFSQKSLGFKSLSSRAAGGEDGQEGHVMSRVRSIGQSVRHLFGKKANSPQGAAFSPVAGAGGGTGEEESKNSCSKRALEDYAEEEDLEACHERSNGDRNPRPKSLLLRQVPNSDACVDLSVRSFVTEAEGGEGEEDGRKAQEGSSWSGDFPVLTLAQLSPTLKPPSSTAGTAAKQLTLLPSTGLACSNTGGGRDEGRARAKGEDVLDFVFGVWSGSQTQSLCSDDQGKDDGESRGEDCSGDEDLMAPVGRTPSHRLQETSPSSLSVPLSTKAPIGATPLPPSPKPRQPTKFTFDGSSLEPQYKTWQPRERASGGSQESIDSDANVSPLPTGWEQCRTPRGKLFYVNHLDRTTHWHLPHESRGSVE